jgi:hypothetical protein
VSLVSYMIPNLIQGVSQQPDALRDPTQGEVQVNAMSSLTDGLRKREGTQSVAEVSKTGLGNVTLHQIQRDAQEQYLVVIARTGIRVFELLTGRERTVVADSGYGYLAGDTNARTDLRVTTIADYTFISNINKLPAMKARTSPASPRPFPHECLVWVKAANYGQSYTVNVNGTSATVQTAIQPVVVNGADVTENRISAAEIATQLRTALIGVDGIDINRRGSVLWIRSQNPITVEATDARANADITAITNSVQSFSELPTMAPNGYQVKIEGDPGNRFDNYYVQFVPREGAGNFGEGAWEETVAPGLPYQIDPATMPHVLVRRPGGTFWFGPADGQLTAGITIPRWGERAAGDLESSPDPSFIGRPIQDVFVFKNRMGFLVDENIILSRSRDFFHFFPETATAVLDTDPIDLTATNPRVALLRYAVPYQDELIVFADQIQFRFNSSGAPLTPSTAQITVLTQYEVDPNVRPIQVAGSIVFCQASGEWSHFQEFSIRGAGTALVADASDLTSYVSSYVPSQVTKLAANDIGYSWFAISGKAGYRNRIYVFKYFSRSTANGMQREQSSWSFWQLNGVKRILQVACVQEVLYVLAEYENGVWLEKMAVSDKSSAVDGKSLPLLDRIVGTAEDTLPALRVANGSYDNEADTTTWELPYRVEARTLAVAPRVQAWDDHGTTAAGGTVLAETSSGRRITARGDWRGQVIYFGETYDFLYRFTRFKLYRDAGDGRVPGNAGRLQVRHARLRYHGTLYFEAHVMAERRPAAVYTFTGKTLDVRNSTVGDEVFRNAEPHPGRYLDGVFTIPIQAQGDSCIVELRSSSPEPCQFTTCEWVGLAFSKARVVR